MLLVRANPLTLGERQAPLLPMLIYEQTSYRFDVQRRFPYVLTQIRYTGWRQSGYPFQWSKASVNNPASTAIPAVNHAA